MALSETGGVFVWGSNSFGQLGEPRVQKQSSCPLQLSAEVLDITGSYVTIQKLSRRTAM